MHASGDREICPHFNTFYEPEKRYKPPRSSLRGNPCSRRSEGPQGCSTKLGTLLSGGADQLFIKLFRWCASFNHTCSLVKKADETVTRMSLSAFIRPNTQKARATGVSTFECMFKTENISLDVGQACILSDGSDKTLPTVMDRLGY
ncbi:LOW QUALITY PROTEIN: hypothetical protein PHMEG_00026861 [Phytophthora megakarya]|uniref:Uncharacterized protein n=1 Tax=Phytophthora megakarya TaxID=4795 RepID=A0A225V8S3_9STRA|nr:LOW QUALITY PROTEIN: hypothetical protein PHMEG_00026861 [Phytophthora megakarya]